MSKERAKEILNEIRCSEMLSVEEEELLPRIIKEFNIKTVVEFGPGVSTMVLYMAGCNVMSYEYDEFYLKKYSEMFSGLDGIHVGRFVNEAEIGVTDNRFDLGFVDSPIGVSHTSRLNTMEYAMRNCEFVILHDTYREGEISTMNYMKIKYDYSIIKYDVGIGFSLLHNIKRKTK